MQIWGKRITRYILWPYEATEMRPAFTVPTFVILSNRGPVASILKINSMILKALSAATEENSIDIGLLKFLYMINFCSLFLSSG